MSPKKVRLVLDLIRGLDVADALVQLNFTAKEATRPVKKLLLSAVANAEHNFGLNRDNLYVKTLFADMGPVMKRFMPKAFGRAGMIRKRTSHVYVVLSERVPTTGAVTKRSSSVVPSETAAGAEESGEQKKVDAKKTRKGGDSSGKNKMTKPRGKGFASRIIQRKSG